MEWFLGGTTAKCRGSFQIIKMHSIKGKRHARKSVKFSLNHPQNEIYLSEDTGNLSRKRKSSENLIGSFKIRSVLDDL